MLNHVIHECPRCGAAIPREHFVRADLGCRRDEYLYCEACERGWETSLYDDGAVYTIELIHRTEPVSFGRFLQRLEDARLS